MLKTKLKKPHYLKTNSLIKIIKYKQYTIKSTVFNMVSKRMLKKKSKPSE